MTIAIHCPHCNNYIETNAPWNCGNPACNNKLNLTVDDFPIISRCKNCSAGQKAFKCPHPDCSETIYLTDEKLATICATFVKVEEKVEDPNVKVEQQKRKTHVDRQDEKEALLHKLHVSELKVAIQETESKIEPTVKIQTPEEELEEFFKKNLGNENAVQKRRTAIENEFKDNPPEMKRRLALLDKWLRQRL
jgi:hypothetical protein